MKRFMIIAALVLAAFTFNSCEEDRWGYDNKVVFSADGGHEDVEGDDSVYTLSIGDKNGNENAGIDIAGVLTANYDWLTATAVKGENEIHLVAAPNKTGKQRKLYVYGMIGNNVMDITVIQNK